MFMQVIQGHVRDVEGLRRRVQEWRQDLQPNAIGFLGSTMGVTPEGTGVLVARFTDSDAAKANGDRPEQSAWWRVTQEMFDGEVSFTDCTDCEVMLGGGSDEAAFVQVISGTATSREAMLAAGREVEVDLRETRPEIIGGVIGWAGVRDFVQVMYFVDEQRARSGEQSMADNPRMARWGQLIEGQPTFLDLRDPTFA